MSATPRLVSLDAFRGFTMFWIIGGRPLVLSLTNLLPDPLARAVEAQLSHSTWEGLRAWDLIWPAFLLMVGMSIPFTMAKRRLVEPTGRLLLDALKRAAILFLLGSLRTSIHEGRPQLFELSSALQTIALAYLASALLAFFSIRVQAAAAALILVLYGLLLAFVPAPGMPAATYQQQGNLVAAIDVIGIGRTHEEGWGTVLSAIPAISTALFGMILGEVLRGGRTERQKLGILALSGCGAVAAGWILSPAIPVIMKLWTTSYGLLSAGWACLGFLAFYWIVDIRGYRAWTFPFVVIGMNAVAAYMGQTILPVSRIAAIFTKNMAAPFLIRWLILFWMYRRKIFLKA